ncbi:MAG: HAMP domain-containing histidine kinase [Kiritimatiellae bacterium]|nr:HAMP domain-containing histidine kinase [Kiritimatiellia bacterium]
MFDLPDLARESERRYFSELEDVARVLASGEGVSDFVWERGKGIISGDVEVFGRIFPHDMTWKDWDPVDKASRKKEMWGFRDIPEGRIVWGRGIEGRDMFVYGAFTDISRRNWALALAIFGGFVFAVLVFTTFVGVKFFLDYIKSRDDFMAATAHDLTTPLVAMQYFIGRDDKEAALLCERLSRLVSNIKDFMRLGGKRPQPLCEEFDLAEAYNEAYELFKEDFRDFYDGDDVDFVCEGNEPIVVYADRTLTVQILWNLLGNDLKYAAPYGMVSVRSFVRGEKVVVELADEGPGMTAVEMRQAFDRYYRAKSVLKTGKGGFGIGLTTARDFARAMGGDLTIKANTPSGCIFTLTLPVARAV